MSNDFSGFISTLKIAPGTTDQLEDGIDNIHSGIIKALNVADAGSFIAHGFKVTSNTNGTFNITAGGYFDKGEYKTLGAQTNANPGSVFSGASASYDWYGLIVINSSGAIAFRGDSNLGNTAAKTADLNDGDIPICVVQIGKGTGHTNLTAARKIQYFGIKKLKSVVSVGEEVGSSGDYTEKLKINSDGTVQLPSNSGKISFPTVGSTDSTLYSTNDAGITNGKVLVANANLSDNDFLKVDGTSIEGRTATELKSDLSLVKADVGLGNVDNTADSAKPVSTAQQNALNLKANLNSPTFTGTIAIPNISDLESAVAANTAKTGITAQQASDITSAKNRTDVLTDTYIEGKAAAKIDALLGADANAIDTLAQLEDYLLDSSVSGGLIQSLAGKVSTTTTVNGHALSSNVTITKADVGLGNVDNDSTATIQAGTTKANVGLANVLNQAQVTTFVSDNAPTATAIGDLWIDSNDDNKMYRASATGSSNWVAVTLGKGALGLVKGDVGLGNVENKSSATIRGEIVVSNIPDLPTSKITSGTFADGLISKSSVIAHSPSATKSDITDLGSDIDISNDFMYVFDGSASDSIKGATIDDILGKITSSQLVGSGKVFSALPASGAEVNVQSNWNESDNTSDAFIQNKPTIPSGNQIIDWTQDQGSTNINAANYINTNQLTTFNIGVDTNSNSTTIAHGETLTFTGGTGISTETTADGTITFTNDSPDQTVSLTGSGATSVSGSYPNFTISSTDNNTTYSTATSSALGLVKIGYSENGKNYPVELDSGQMYVNVPWTNTNQLTTFTLRGTTNTSPTTVNHSDTITIAAGTGITTTSTSDGVITVASTLTSNATHTGDVTGSTTLTIADDAVTYAKMQNVSATNRLLGRDSSGAGIIEEIAPADVLTMLGVETGATADQTASEIRALVESASDSNVFTDADHTKLNAIEASATADQTGAEIKTALFNESDTNNLTDTLLSKLNAIEASATADQTAAEIRTLVESATDSNVFTDADHSKLNAIEASADVTSTANVRTALNAAMPSNTLTIGDGSTAVTIPGDLIVTGDTKYSNETIQIVTDNTLAFRAGDGNSNEILLTANDATADRTITLPDAAGTVAVSASAGIALSSAGNITANLSASHIPTITASKVTEISNLTAAEGEQLENIGSTTISAAQWGYLGAATGAITNTDVDVNVSNLTARLPQITESVTIGDATDVTVTTSGDLTVTGDLNVSEIIDPSGTGHLKLRAGSSYVHILDGGVSNHINISPASGRLNLYAETIAMGDADVTMTTRGAYDLTLSTNNGTNSGSIVIADGANGDISITPNGTGQVNLGNFQFDVDQTVGSGQDNYVLTYDHANTQISLEAAASGGIASLAADTTPQLGGDLDVNGNKITSASNADITIEPDGTGDVNLFTDTVIVGDSNENFQLQHRTTTASILQFQSGGNTRLNSDGNIYLNSNQGSGGSLIRLNGNTITSGSPGANVTMTTQGTGDLTLSTNSGTNSGTIKIFDGADGNIELTPNGTGNVSLGNFTFNADQTVGSGQDNYVLTYDNSAGTIGLEEAAGGGSPGGSDTFIQYNNGGSFGATTLSYDDTAGSEQFLFDDTSDQPLVKIVQRGSGHAFEVHDQASDSSIFTISEVGQVTIKTATPQAGGLTINDDMYVGQIKSSTFGSASSPRYTFHSDSNTGMYSGGADILKFTTGGTERVKLSSSGLQLGAANAEVTTILDEDDLSSDSATALATQQSIKAYVDNNAGGGSPAGSDTFIQYNNGGSFGATTLAFDDTAGSEQILLDDTSDVALMKIVQRGTGSSFEVHDQASDSTVFQVSSSGGTSIGLGAGSGAGADLLFVQGRSSGQIWTASTDGSASAPVFTRRTDLNTGMYFIGGDNIGITTGGTLRVDISDSGLKLGSSGSRVTTILDEDDMSTNSDTALATQQSIKAYVDNNAGGASLANDANNRLVTATGSGGINGEANLTFDGSTLALAGKQTITVDDTVSEAFKVTITDTDGTADSTPFVVDGDGRVGIGTASPVSGFALTLNGDGTSYEGLAFQSGGSTKFKQSSDGSAMYFDSAINTGNVNFRVKDGSGNLRPALGIEGANFSVAVGYNGTSGSSLTPNNTFQVNVGTENGVQDKDDGILLLNSDLSIADGDKIAGIGFATRDGNIPSVTTEAAAAIVAYAAEDHGTGDKGGHLAFLTSAIDDDDDTASTERMRITSEGKVIIGDTPNFTSQHDSTSKFTIQGTDAGMLIEKHDDSASGGPTLSLYRYSASEADGDLIGQVNFRGEGSTGNPSTYISVRTEIEDTTEGTKDGALIIRGLVNNSQTNMAEFHAAGLTLSQGSYNIGNVSKDANTVSGSSLANGSSVTLFTVPATTRGFKATIFFKDTSNTEYQIEEIMGYNTGSGVDFTSFGQVYSGSAAIGSLDASNSSGTTLIKFTNAQGSAINYQASISVTHMDLS